jgi:hypothetical protein
MEYEGSERKLELLPELLNTNESQRLPRFDHEVIWFTPENKQRINRKNKYTVRINCQP